MLQISNVLGTTKQKMDSETNRNPFSRKVGDSNPRYGNPYVSLANWWFQPLTQPSKMLPFEAIQNVLTLV